MASAARIRAFRARAGKLPDPPEATPIPGTPTYIRKVNAVQDIVNDNNHSVSLLINVPYSGGALLVPYWMNSGTNWMAISGATRSVSTSVVGNTVNQGMWMDAWAGGGSESHGGTQCAWIINPTVGDHTITVNMSIGAAFGTLGAGALFYANCSSVTASGTAGGGSGTSRSFNVSSATSRTTLGIFLGENTIPPTRNGTLRWSAMSTDMDGWNDWVVVQEIPGAASVTHSISGGGPAWGFGLSLAA